VLKFCPHGGVKLGLSWLCVKKKKKINKLFNAMDAKLKLNAYLE
jgi:hypothetical protein